MGVVGSARMGKLSKLKLLISAKVRATAMQLDDPVNDPLDKLHQLACKWCRDNLSCKPDVTGGHNSKCQGCGLVQGP